MVKFFSPKNFLILCSLGIPTMLALYTLFNAVLQFASTSDCSIRDFQRELSFKLQNIHVKCIMVL